MHGSSVELCLVLGSGQHQPSVTSITGAWHNRRPWNRKDRTETPSWVIKSWKRAAPLAYSGKMLSSAPGR